MTLCGGSPSAEFLFEGAGDRVRVVDAAGPGATGGSLESGPKARVGGELWVSGEIGAGEALREDVGSLGGADKPAIFPDEIDRTFESIPVDEDLDQVAVADLADG